MKLKIKKYKTALTIPLFVGVLGLFFACNDEWDEHYENNETGNEQTLLSALKQDPELSMFVKMIEISELTQGMDGLNAYTVFAPSNADLTARGISLENLSARDTVTIRNMTKNHIARYFYSTSEIEFNKKRILMLSKKYIYFEKAGNGYLFDEQPLTMVNSICSNGVLHKLTGVSTYRDNLWEYIKNTNDLKSMYDFIIQYDSTYLDKEWSKPIGINEDGYTVYDSVLIFKNSFMEKHLGSLNLEDSIYTIIAPTQLAYTKTFDVYKNYYKSHGGLDGKLNADSVTKHRTDSMIVNNLVFRGEYQNLLNKDSVITTTKTVFKKNWRGMFNGDFHKASNGDIMITNELNQNIYESVQKTLKRNFLTMPYGTSGFTYTQAAVDYLVPQEGTEIKEAIGGFMILRESSGTPVLSVYPGEGVVSEKYDIICTIIPGVASDSLNIDEQTILDFKLVYNTGPRTTKTVELKTGVITDPLNVMYVELKGVEIPYIDVNARLTITINVKAADLLKGYKRQVRIKEVIYKPAGITD